MQTGEYLGNDGGISLRFRAVDCGWHTISSGEATANTTPPHRAGRFQPMRRRTRRTGGGFDTPVQSTAWFCRAEPARAALGTLVRERLILADMRNDTRYAF